MAEAPEARARLAAKSPTIVGGRPAFSANPRAYRFAASASSGDIIGNDDAVLAIEYVDGEPAERWGISLTLMPLDRLVQGKPVS